MRGRLRESAREAWQEHERAERILVRHLVRPSVPVLFFGDSVRFARSLLRVVTVGLNPSREEFPPEEPLRRFPSPGPLSSADLDTYLAALDGYFQADPYTDWFDESYGQVLEGLGASYYDGWPSAALHTDLCTPLATDPTWNRLSRDERAALEPAGRLIWHHLTEALQPDVVLVSVRRQLLDEITFPLTGDASVIHTVTETADGEARASPYRVEAARRVLASGKEPLFIFGRASQTPFGSISHAEKQEVGRRILAAMRQ
jgi:hypothetical protein